MNKSKIEFKTVSELGVYEFSGRGLLNICGDKVRISFFDEKNNCEYAFSFLSDSRIVFARKGEIEYTFSLEKSKECRFFIKALNGEIDCVSYCNALKIDNLDTKISVYAKYKMNVGGNKQNYKVYLTAYKV